jgi:hypothetical protein
MKLLIFASCSKSKVLEHISQPTCEQLTSKEAKKLFGDRFTDKRPASKLYKGPLNISINSAVAKLRKIFDVAYYIVSAGFGIVHESELLPPYNCTFAGMKKNEILERAKKLEIPEDFQKIIQKEQPDVIYLALGKDYLNALGDWDQNLPCKTIAFDSSESNKVITLPADHLVVKEVASVSSIPIHGVIGYKGDLLLLTTRYIEPHSNPEEALKDLLENPDELTYLVSKMQTS